MKKHSKAGFLPVMLLSMLLAHVALASAERDECHVCGMWIDQYMKTRHVAVHRDGHRVSFCSIACASKYLLIHSDEVESVLAADYLSTDLLEADRAVYLSGSDVFGVMTYTSRIAFADMARAEQFRKQHGGNIIDFKKALEELRSE